MTTTATGPELVGQYNALVDVAQGLGIEGYVSVKRFATREVGQRRVADLEQLVNARQAELKAGHAPVEIDEGQGVPVPSEEENAMARKTKAKKTAKTAKVKKNGGARGRPVAEGTVSVKTLTEQFNALVPAAQQKGIKWARHHSSLFGSKAAGEAQVKRLQDALRAA